MTNRFFFLMNWLIPITLTLVSCVPQRFPSTWPTPIPTLIPATMPSRNAEVTQTSPQVIEGYPVGIPSANAGMALYAEHCAECHGADGNGVVPDARNFGDVDYMRGETPATFYQVISEGRGPDMPAFGEALSSDERWDVTYFVWHFSTTPEKLTTGKKIYDANCVACHGQDGRSMILGAADFSDIRFISNMSPSDSYVVVTQGKGSMPAWQARLNKDERWDVIDYINSFTYDPNVNGELEISTTELDTEETERSECDSYTTQTNPFSWDDTETIVNGEVHYVSCEGCHGADGKGNIPGVIDFSNPVFQADLRSNPGSFLCSLAEGLNTMPPFTSSLSEEEMWQVLTYLGVFSN